MNTNNASEGTCEKIKQNGRRCQAKPIKNSRYCFFHDPSKTKDRAAARRAGGIQRSRRICFLPPETPDRALRSSADVLELLDDLINKVLRGELDTKIAYAAGHLISIQMKVRDHELEDRLQAVEKVVNRRRVESHCLLTEEPEEGAFVETDVGNEDS